MASTLTRLLVHATFSTKNREPLIDDAHEPDLYGYIGGICRNMGSPLLAIGGVSDHVHLLVSLGKSVCVSDLMLNVKKDSSRWMNEHSQSATRFSWQDGYFAFSIGESGVDALRRYIDGQKAHHATVDFQVSIFEQLQFTVQHHRVPLKDFIRRSSVRSEPSNFN